MPPRVSKKGGSKEFKSWSLSLFFLQSYQLTITSKKSNFRNFLLLKVWMSIEKEKKWVFLFMKFIGWFMSNKKDFSSQLKTILTLYLSLRILFLNFKLLLCFRPPKQKHNFPHGYAHFFVSYSSSKLFWQISSSTSSLSNAKHDHPRLKYSLTFRLITSL